MTVSDHLFFFFFVSISSSSMFSQMSFSAVMIFLSSGIFWASYWSKCFWFYLPMFSAFLLIALWSSFKNLRFSLMFLIYLLMDTLLQIIDMSTGSVTFSCFLTWIGSISLLGEKAAGNLYTGIVRLNDLGIFYSDIFNLP